MRERWECGGEINKDSKHLIATPDVKVKGDVGFELQFVFLPRLKYTVGTVIVFEELTVQKPEEEGDAELSLEIISGGLILGRAEYF